MDAERAMSQDIRPLEVVILNLMPLKEDTELQLLIKSSSERIGIPSSFAFLFLDEPDITSLLIR